MADREALKRLYTLLQPHSPVPLRIQWAEGDETYHIIRYQQLDGHWRALYLPDDAAALWLHALALAVQWGAHRVS